VLEDLRWLLAMWSARRARRHMTFSGRQRFDDYVRPKTRDGATIAYPDAIYHLTGENVSGAIKRLRNDQNIEMMLG
jgi:hypothetical protein